jgi:acetyltransferase-like isoleucine patch superfamily enzyme
MNDHARTPMNRHKSDRPIVERVINRFKSELPREMRIRLHQVKEAARLLFLKRDVGKNTYIDRTVHVLGWRSISIGHSSAISEGTWLNVNQRTKDHKHIVIGNNCFIGKRNFFSSGWQIHLGDYCMTGLDCRLMSGDHLFDSPMLPYVVGGVTNEKVIRLGTNVRLGAGVAVVGNVSIGHGSVIGAESMVNKDIPPFSIAFGNPCTVHKRFDFSLSQWVLALDFDKGSEERMPDEAAYLDILRSSHPSIAMPLQACSRGFGDMR